VYALYVIASLAASANASAVTCGANTPGPAIANVAYGSDPLQRFDVWQPAKFTGLLPAVITFHGGGFTTGSRNPPPIGVIDCLVPNGYIVVNADFRLAPQAPFPASMQDGARVIQWLRHYHLSYGIDPNRIAAVGGSSGGALAIWLALHPDMADPASANPVDRESSRVATVVTSNAQSTYDALTLQSIFDTTQLGSLYLCYGLSAATQLWDPSLQGKEQAASPVTYVHAGQPSMLLYYERDPDVGPPSNVPVGSYVHDPAQGFYLQNASRLVGASVTLHTGSYYPTGWNGFLLDMVQFINAAFGRSS
jgi:acetyl esterase/lipase